jgi:hypothetical protein
VGKEKVPTIAYNVTANHRRFIHHVTAGPPGTRNDKTLSWFDEFLMKVKDNEYWTDMEFELIDINGVPHIQYGVWILCDGGYHRWRIMQCPLKEEDLSEEGARAWSKRAESVRKDIECTFGVLKARFRCLKLPMFWHGAEGKAKCDNVFFVCCMLHNMLLQHDKLMDWEADIDWGQADGMGNWVPGEASRWDHDTVLGDVPDWDYSNAEAQVRISTSPSELEVFNDPEWNVLREKLIVHFNHPEARKTMACMKHA